MSVRSSIKELMPSSVRDFLRNIVISYRRAANRHRMERHIFDEIYRRNAWGGNPGEFYSGSGSVGRAADAYCDYVTTFIRTRGVKSVLDIGCGDFRIGQRIANSVDSYVGIDVVADLIDYNRTKYGARNIRFLCADAAREALPAADLCLIRQVFQHLSNRQINAILGKLKIYRHVLVTEHYPANVSALVGNIDKTSGPDTRIYDGSAVVLDASPFNVSAVSLVLQVEANDYLLEPGETIRSFLFSGNSVHN